ncbi:MAG: hypothetical protein ABL885_06800 [Methylophilaceae bacterium]
MQRILTHGYLHTADNATRIAPYHQGLAASWLRELDKFPTWPNNRIDEWLPLNKFR